MRTDIDLKFGDGTYTFRLRLLEIAELQRKTGTGIGALFARLIKGRFTLEAEELGGAPVHVGDPTAAQYAIADVLEPIRLGLIGGGIGRVNGEAVTVDPIRAQELMDLYCYPARPLSEAWTFAVSILTACIEGWVDPDPKKKEPSVTPETETPADGSTSPLPTETAPSPGAEPEKPDG